MSKLIDMLRKISQGEPHRIGFRNLQAAAAKIPAIGIVAHLSRPDVDLARRALQAEADAILIQVENLDNESSALEEALKVAGGVPCGVKLESAVPDDIGKLASAGADFLAFHTETAPSAVLREEKMGRVMAIDPYLDDSLLRTIDRLALDAVILELEQGNEEFLTVRDLMACRRAVDMVRKPLILRIGHKMSPADLANVRDLGIESVLVDFSGAASTETLSRLRAAIAELPPRRRSREGLDVVLPRQMPKAVEPEDDEL